jgi:hypothetical protein
VRPLPPEHRSAGAGGAPTTRDAERCEARLERLAADLRVRLRPVCRDWSDADFEALVRDVARFKARWSADTRPV